MPDHSSSTQMLRDDILAQLRGAGRPLSTTHLRRHAAKLPVAGAVGTFAPLQQQVYRALCGLARDQLVTRAADHGRHAAWQLTPAGAAAEEIADLECLLELNCPRPASPPMNHSARVRAPNPTRR